MNRLHHPPTTPQSIFGTRRYGVATVAILLFALAIGPVWAADATPKSAPPTAPTTQSATVGFEPLPRDDGSIWVATREWNEEEEKGFSKWITETIDENFFVRYNIATVCVDVPYALRYIYARIRFLPQGSHSAGGYEFGNWSKSFAGLPRNPNWAKDQRFRAALNSLIGTLQVRNIPYDTYPIKIWPKDGMLRAGTVFSNESHSGIVFSLDRSAFFPILTAYSTLPPAVRKLVLINYEEELTYDDIGRGLTNWNWWRRDPATGRYVVVPDEQMPGYSMEQYDYPEELAQKLQEAYSIARTDINMAFDEAFRSLHNEMEMRIGVVRDGYNAYHNRGDRSTGSVVYDFYSTPGRDARIRRQFADLDVLVKQGFIDENTLFDRISAERFNPGNTRDFNLLEFRHALKMGLVSYEPWDSPNKRWGIFGEYEMEWQRKAAASVENIAQSPDGAILLLTASNISLCVTPKGEVRQPTAEQEKWFDKIETQARTFRSTYHLPEGSAAPLPLADGGLVVIRPLRKVERYDAQGKLLWTRDYPERIYAGASQGIDGTIYVPAETGLLRALNPDTGNTIWQTQVGDRLIYPVTPYPNGDGVAVAGSSRIITLTRDGKIRWTRSLPDAIYSPVGVGMDGSVASGSLDEKVHFFTPSGQELWAFPAGNSVQVAPKVLEGNRVIAVTSDGTVFGLATR
jgi:hypothetical protein